MNHFAKTTLWALCFAISLGAVFDAQAKGPKVPYQHPGMTVNNRADEDKVNWTDAETIAASLPKAPITVAFDIDDTVLVSSQCFYYGRKRWSPDSYDYLHNQEFWDFVADGCDQYSIPKESAFKLIEMHQARGDTILFLTGRTPARDHDDNTLDELGEILRDTFKITDMHPVLYSRETVVAPYQYDKTAHLKNHHVALYYGDSDSDILAAKEAGIRAIRVIRSAVSTNRPLPLNGGYGEEVVRESWY